MVIDTYKNHNYIEHFDLISNLRGQVKDLKGDLNSAKNQINILNAKNLDLTNQITTYQQTINA